MMVPAQVSIAKIIEFLQEPSSYPHHAAEVEIRQTHASVLAIVPPYVYKVKKHVNLGFLDFTTLEARKNNCEKERYLNSRFCASLYVDIIPISLKNDLLFFGIGGQIVEYALQMKQLPDGYFLNQFLQTKQVITQTIDQVLIILKEFYTNQLPDPFVVGHGHWEKIQEAALENTALLQQHSDNFMHPPAIEFIHQYLTNYLKVNQELFQKRVREQKIKDCHGDLHLEHIHIYEGEVSIYDCIEFNDSFRYIDVASDIAFLAMDFDFHGRSDLSFYVANGMAELLHDPDMLLLMDFYKCYRACVRAKVECIKSQEPEVPESDRQTSLKTAQRYLNLALSYSLFGSGPVVLVICGRSGSGKSTLAQYLTELLNWKYLSSDITRKELFELPLYQRPDQETRQSLYSKPVTDQVYQTLLNETLSHVKKNQNVLVDATFGLPEHRSLFMRIFDDIQIPLYFLELQTSDEVIKHRLTLRDTQKQVNSDARSEDFDLLKKIYHEPSEMTDAHLLKINAESDLTSMVTTIMARISGLNCLTKSA